MKLRKSLMFILVCSLGASVSTGVTSVRTLASTSVVVAKDGSGNYTSVQQAINSVPDNNKSWYTINIKKGTYKEVIKVPSSKKYIKLVGEDVGSTKLTYDNCSSTIGGTTASASVTLQGDNLFAKNITFENSFDYDKSTLANKQAVACEPTGDRQIFVNCRFTGNQDTLYVKSGRQYFKDCYINGHTDFIFGDATAVFNNCEVYSKNKSGASITAPNTASKTQYGLVFLNSKLTADSNLKANSVYLGRPWHPSSNGDSVNSSSTFVNCNLGAHINSAGWTKMGTTNPSTERFREYKNTGAGAVVNSSRKQLTDSEAKNYTVKNILKGRDSWNPDDIIALMK